MACDYVWWRGHLAGICLPSLGGACVVEVLRCVSNGDLKASRTGKGSFPVSAAEPEISVGRNALSEFGSEIGAAGLSLRGHM